MAVGWLNRPERYEADVLNRTLQELRVPIVSDEDCITEEIKNMSGRGESLICAGPCIEPKFPTANHKSLLLFSTSVNGDSSPICIGVGIKAGGVNGELPPGGLHIFQELSYHVPWIKEVIEGNSQVHLKSKTPSQKVKGQGTRIFGGSVPKPHTYPSIVSLQGFRRCRIHFCAGLILHEEWILTGKCT